MRGALFLLLLISTAPALAQQGASIEEIVVTARRASSEVDNPAIGLRRLADFAVQEVDVVGDTREPEKRREEIFAMVKGAIDLAAKRGNIELATGTTIVTPLTLSNYRSLVLKSDSRPDTNRTSILVKTRLSAGADAKAAIDRIDAFVKDVPPVGRAEMKASGDLTLSVVQPDQYRGEIISLVADDVHATLAKIGSDYAVEIHGLDRPVEWSRASVTDVFLYVPYSYTVAPKGH